jgi:hypothetical protein
MVPAMPPFLRAALDRGMDILYVVQQKIAFTAGQAPPVEVSLVPALLVNTALAAGLILAHLYIIKKRFFIERLDGTDGLG